MFGGQPKPALPKENQQPNMSQPSITQTSGIHAETATRYQSLQSPLSQNQQMDTHQVHLNQQKCTHQYPTYCKPVQQPYDIKQYQQFASLSNQDYANFLEKNELKDKINELVKNLDWERQNRIRMEKEYSSLKVTKQNENKKTITCYSTDEEDVERETSWVKHSKKRKKYTGHSISAGASVSNQKKSQLKDFEIKKPPPIYVEDKDLQKVSALVNEATGNKFTTKSLGDGKIKVNAEDVKGYTETVKCLADNSCSFYTYENKQTRPIRVMAMGLDHSWDPEDIRQDLTNRGYNCLSVTSKLEARTKRPLNMFTLCFDSKENIDSIYKINQILKQIIKICPMKTSKLVPQCKRCQEFGHTKNNCHKGPRCVKCGQEHLTVDCKKPKEVRPKCANCQGEHTASYRGCMVAIEMQKKKDELQKKNNKVITQSNKSNAVRIDSGVRQPGVTYAQTAAKNISQPKVPEQTNIESMLQKILLEMSGLRKDNAELKEQNVELRQRIDQIESRSKPGRKSNKKNP